MAEQSGDVVQRSMNFDRDRVDQIIAEADREMAAETSAKVNVEVKPVTEAKAPEVAKVEAKPAVIKDPSLPGNGFERFCERHIKVVSFAALLLHGAIGATVGACGAYWRGGDVVMCIYAGIWGFTIGMFGALPSFELMSLASTALEKTGVARILAVPANAIATTALGIWTAGKTTVCGIGIGIKCTGVGLYYSVANQLMPSAAISHCQAACRRFGSDDCVPTVIGFAHVVGLAYSIAFVVRGGHPLMSKFIFGWWAFYALNVFYLIGQKVRESKKAS